MSAKGDVFSAGGAQKSIGFAAMLRIQKRAAFLSYCEHFVSGHDLSATALVGTPWAHQCVNVLLSDCAGRISLHFELDPSMRPAVVLKTEQTVFPRPFSRADPLADSHTAYTEGRRSKLSFYHFIRKCLISPAKGLKRLRGSAEEYYSVWQPALTKEEQLIQELGAFSSKPRLRKLLKSRYWRR